MVDIIIRAKNGHDLTRKCVQSIHETTTHPYRIIFVDDGSDPIQEVDCDIWIRTVESRGAVTATNLGLSASLNLDGDYVIVMDNDTEIPRGDSDWLTRFAAEMEQYDDTGALGATTNYASGNQFCLHMPLTYQAVWKDDRNMRMGIKENPESALFVSFCCMLRKNAVRNVGLWDERYNPGNWEDTDYALQLRSSGWKVRVARSVYIHHLGHKTFGADVERLFRENGTKFVAKWGPGRLMDMGILDPQQVKALL